MSGTRAGTRRRHGALMVLVVMMTWLTGVGGMAVAGASSNCRLPDDSTTGTPDYAGTGDRVIRTNVPDRLLSTGCDWSSNIRAIALHPSRVDLHQGGDIVRRVELPTGQIRLEDLVDAIDDPTWLAEPTAGVIEIRAALMARTGTSLLIEGPRVTDVRLVDLPFVHLGGSGATARIARATVTSWNADGSGPATTHDRGRPYVLFADESHFDVVDSTFQRLGSDTSRAYGVAWFSGSRGSAVDSTFTNGYFGVYTHEAIDLRFIGNTFSNNELYGWDPHDDSHGLVADGNVAHGNGSHGFIVSNGVHDSIIRNNHAYDNGGNGIVIDRESYNITVHDNLVEDNADGIVVNNAGRSLVRNNIIRNNRTGVRIKGPSTGMVIADNTISGGERGIQAYNGAEGITIRRNTIDGPTSQGLLIEAPHTMIYGTRITDTPVGLEIRSGSTTARFLTIDGVTHGVKIKTPEWVELTALRIRADLEGIRASKINRTTAAALRITAPTAEIGLRLPSEAIAPF